MNEGTSVLLGLEDEFAVLQLSRVDPDTVKIVIEVIDPEGACPGCGVPTSRVKERPLVRVKDLPASGQRTELWWLKRRLVCPEVHCATVTFTQQSTAVPARARLTTRLREKIGSAIASGNRAVSEVAGEYGVAWSTAHRALITMANRWLPEPEPTRVLGIDETRARSVRWVLQEAGWKRSDPWMTSFVNADPTAPGRLLGLTPGRSGACVTEWLALQTPAFRSGVELVVIDPSAPYAAGIRTALPDARIAVDKWHLVALANLMVTQVRQRITRQLHGRRGVATDKVWASRQLLLTGYEHLSPKQRARFQAALAAEDPTNEIAAAHAVKERLRMLLAEHEPHLIRRRLYDFYDAAARADMEETTRLATTIDTWWPAVLVALTEDVTNARTEGFNRIIKQTKRVGCGFTNMDNYRRRIMVHIALTRGQRPAA
ncbi:ISL3 family transposase [Humibacillus xanthopallidus]|uniref:Transposase n=1 Tax=Humibacillus xanthopallidus TaxID=412689 RepID=A0A543I0H4_9MICO|nr:ISL3 family transposase [Humibacillus xanthopallidus]TQM64104.1 transposase [Humibacillus xanthopallidus]